MFAVRGIAVSFSVFAIVYCALSVTVCGVWRRVWLGGQGDSARRCADLLFVLRLAPLVVAAGVTLLLAVPSFLLLEPRSVDEPMGAAPVMLSLCGMALLLVGGGRASPALGGVPGAVARWSSAGRESASSPVDSVDS